MFFGYVKVSIWKPDFSIPGLKKVLVLDEVCRLKRSVTRRSDLNRLSCGTPL